MRCIINAESCRRANGRPADEDVGAKRENPIFQSIRLNLNISVARRSAIYREIKR